MALVLTTIELYVPDAGLDKTPLIDVLLSDNTKFSVWCVPPLGVLPAKYALGILVHLFKSYK